MLDRRVDIGDISPDDATSLANALNSGAQVSELRNLHLLKISQHVSL